MMATPDRSAAARFRDLVRARTGMAFPESRASDVMRAVQRAAADTGAPDPAALYDLLAGPARSGDSLDALLAALNVGETHFFRDATQMQALEQHILPELIARRRRERRLRLWSAACSTGEEAYTLAILVDRLLPDLARWDVLILATDVNNRSLHHARRGMYGAWSLRGLPPPALTACFTRHGERYEVAPRLRAMVTFAPLNLAEDVYPSVATNTEAMDLVLCRNVLLYFDQEGGRALVRRLRDALGDGGRLLVGPVDAGLRVFDGLAHDLHGTGIFHRMLPGASEPDPRSQDLGAVRQPVEREAPAPSSPSCHRPIPRRPGPGDPADPLRAHEEVLGLWREGRVETALRRLEAAVQNRPLAAPLHYLHGLILLDAGRRDEALTAFRRCTYADPELAVGHLARAGLLARIDRPGQARAALETTARLVAGFDPDAPVVLGDGLTAGGVRELIAAQRGLVAPHSAADASRG